MRILSVKAQIRDQLKNLAVQYMPPHAIKIFLISLTILITIDVMASTILTMTQV